MKANFGYYNFEYDEQTAVLRILKGDTLLMQFDGDGRVRFTNETNYFPLVFGKLEMNCPAGMAYTGTGLQMYMSGTKIVLAGIDSSQESKWVYIDLDNLGAGWQTSNTEP